jgi:hypothetical protein
MSSLCRFVPWEKALRSFDDCCPEQLRPRDFQKGGYRLLRTIVQQSIHTGIHYLLYFYYVLKPVIPAGIRFAFRHYHAMPLKWTSAATWPINRAYVGKPANWPGWPNGKQFAFVLSHDVEGEKGLKRCRSLAELEMRLHFRSSYNFVPEGEYHTPTELRTYLIENGFEVGVHDLHHDGSLYQSQVVFNRSAMKINRYMNEWNAVGFRSGFMRHDLDWISKLHIRYDASTFDSDPFEPQPDGMKTIFPFWVYRADASAYLELPYTLAQDSTLFLVLREKNNDVWKRKLAWIAEHGGMAFVIVHPDYIALDGKASSSEYHVDLFHDFLEYTREVYSDTAWFARPCDIEQYVRVHFPSARTAPEKFPTSRHVSISGK